jgi:hypothetical protein
MLRASYETSLGTVELWSEKSPDASCNQDSYLIDERSDGLRLAVLDGVTPMTPEPWRLGLDRARYAAEMVRAALLANCSVKEAAEEAHRLIYRPEIPSYRDQPMTALVAADVAPSGDWSRVSIYGDCEAWVRRSGDWQMLDAGDTLHPLARQGYQGLVARRDEMSFRELRVAEGELLADESYWRRTCIGQFEAIQCADFALVEWEALVLASDGALLNPERIHRLDEWLGELREWENGPENTRRFKRRDDVTVLRLNAI